jgi:hypothetical protein
MTKFILLLTAFFCLFTFAQAPANKKLIYLSSDTLVADEERKNADNSPSQSYFLKQGEATLGNLMASGHTPLLGKYGSGSYIRMILQDSGTLSYEADGKLKEFDTKNDIEKQTILELKNYLKGKTLEPSMVKFVKKYFPDEKIEKVTVAGDKSKGGNHGGEAKGARSSGVELFKLALDPNDPLCKDGKCEVPKNGVIQAKGEFLQAPTTPAETGVDPFFKKLDSEAGFKAALEKAKTNGDKSGKYPPLFFVVTKDKNQGCPLCDVVQDYMSANKDALAGKALTYQLDPLIAGNAAAIAKNRAYHDKAFPNQTMYFGTGFRYNYNPKTKQYEFDEQNPSENITKSGFVLVRDQYNRQTQAPSVPVTSELDKLKK